MHVAFVSVEFFDIFADTVGNDGSIAPTSIVHSSHGRYAYGNVYSLTVEQKRKRKVEIE